VKIQILDDNHTPTQDFIHGRPLVRLKAWINGDMVLESGYGLIDTGSRLSAICHTKIGNNTPDEHIPNEHMGGQSTTGFFRLCAIQIDRWPQVPVGLTLFEGRHFHVIIGRDFLRCCRLVMDHAHETYTLTMRVPTD
jgi:hypothetical protein